MLDALALDGADTIVVCVVDADGTGLQQATVDTWLPWLSELRERMPGIEVYEVPTISRRWLPARRVIDGGTARQSAGGN